MLCSVQWPFQKGMYANYSLLFECIDTICNWFSLSIKKYNDLISKYETILVDFINVTMNTQKALGSIAPNQIWSDNILAKNVFSMHPTGKLKSLDNRRDKLTPGVKILHVWMIKTLGEFLLYNSRRLFEQDIEALVTKRICITNSENVRNT